MDQSLKLNDILRILRRRAVMIVSIVFVFSTLAVLTAYLIPPIYVAQAKILIESQQIPSQLASSTVTATATERLQLIEQRLMTRSNLLGLVDRLALYEERPDLSRTDKVELLRRSTRFQRINIDTGDRRGATVSAFVLSHSDSDAKRAALITNEFVTMVLEQNLRARSERASQTHDFFKDEVAQVEKDLLEVEAEMAAFRQENEMAMPETLRFRRDELARLREERFELLRRILSLQENRDTLSAALGSGQYSDGLGEGATPQEQDLAGLQQELTRARGVYAESHPRIKALQTRIAVLETTIRDANPEAAPVTATERAERAKAKLERQLRLIDTELGLLTAQKTRGDVREKELEASIERTPEVGMAMGALQRRYDELKIRYEESVRKQAFAATGEKLEVNRQAERFEVIEQAQVPAKPDSPNRPAIAIGGVAGSIGFALSLALLMGLLNNSIRTVGDMERKLDMRPLMTVPYIATDAERRRARRELYILSTLVLIVIPLGLYIVDQYYLPLNLIIDQIAERINLREVMARLSDMINK